MSSNYIVSKPCTRRSGLVPTDHMMHHVGCFERVHMCAVYGSPKILAKFPFSCNDPNRIRRNLFVIREEVLKTRRMDYLAERLLL